MQFLVWYGLALNGRLSSQYLSFTCSRCSCAKKVKYSKQIAYQRVASGCMATCATHEVLVTSYSLIERGFERPRRPTFTCKNQMSNFNHPFFPLKSKVSFSFIYLFVNDNQHLRLLFWKRGSEKAIFHALSAFIKPCLHTAEIKRTRGRQ